jgi:hypothetical protein
MTTTTLYAFQYRNPRDTSQLGPVYALVAGGRVWVKDGAMARRLGVDLATTHKLIGTDPLFSVPIIGDSP